MGKMKKKIIKGFICTVIMVSILAMGETDLLANNNETIQAYTEEELNSINKKINELRAKRAEYYSVGNQEMIDKIDQELYEYGVEQVNISDVQDFITTNGNDNNVITNRKSTGVSTYMLPEPVVNNNRASWEKRSYNTVYQGAVYSIVEYNEYMSPNVDKRYFVKDYAGIEAKTSNTTFGKTLFKAVASTLTNIGGNVNGNLAVLSTGLSIYDAVKDVMTSVNKSTTINDVEAVLKYKTTNETVFVYAKKYGDSDNSYVMAYSGNVIHSQVTCIISGLKYINNKAYPDDITSSIYFDSYSPKYNGRSSEACCNYNLISSGKNPNCNYNVYSFKIQLFDKIVTIEAVRPYYIFT